MTTPMLWQTMACRDAPVIIRFLVDGLGFTEAASYPDPDDPSRIAHAELLWPPGGGVMLGTFREGSPGPQHPGAASSYCVTTSDADVDRLHAQALAHGGTSVQPPEDMDYGGRGSTVADPEGNRWSLGSYRGSAQDGG